MNLRTEMPETAAFIDAMREAFGKEGIDASIKKGMAGLPGYFYARENGLEAGTQPLPARIEISGADMVLGPFNPANKEPHANRNHRR